MTAGPLGMAYSAAIEKFNAGDMQGFGEVLADGCVFQLRAAVGWVGQDVLGTLESGNSMAAIAKNRFADGRTFDVSGCAVFENGKIVQMRALGGLPTP